NHIFMLLPTRGEEVYRNVWLPMEETLAAENLEGLARVDLQRRGSDANRDEVYRMHAKRLEPIARDEGAIEQEVRDLAKRSAHYRRLIDPRSEPDTDVRSALQRLNRWGAQTTFPLL